MPKKHLVPFTKTEFTKTIHDVEVPAEFDDFIKLGANVRRYKFQEGNFDHIFDDFVDEHTKRMVLYAEQLPISQKLKEEVIRTIWIHDLPEILDSQTNGADITAIDKIRNPDLATASKNREKKLLEENFSKYDQDLYHAFDPAKEMLYTGDMNLSRTTPAGMIARVLDVFIEGTNSFHGFVVEYLLSDEFDESLSLPDQDSFEYCFRRGVLAYQNTSKIQEPQFEDARKVILDILLKDYFGYIEQAWSSQAVSRLPLLAAKEYENCMQYAKNGIH